MDRRLLQRRLKALAGGSRLEILAFLKKKQIASVTEIAEAVHRSLKTVSTHLQRLIALEILERHQRGRTVFYRLSPSQEPPVKHVLPLL
jgi:DNA-binding transcriptional ArsR family regulator